MLLKVDCLPNTVGKQPSIPLIDLGRKSTLTDDDDEFKIATPTFKVLKFQKPAYIYDLIASYIHPRSLRSSDPLT